MKLKFIRNRASFKVTNSTHEAVTFHLKEILGIIDLRSLGYYKIKQVVLQQNPSCMYHFKSANEVCNQFNKPINTLRKEEKDTFNTDNYPWLDDSDERKHMTDREILDKYIDLKDSCLTKQEKQKLRDIIYDYKDAFSLRDEIGTCPNIKVEIDVTDNSPFFIRPFHAKEEDRAILDKEMKMVMLFRNLERRFFSLFKPSYISKPKGTPRQKGSDGFQTSEYEDSQKQSSLSTVKGHVHIVRRFQM